MKHAGGDNKMPIMDIKRQVLRLRDCFRGRFLNRFLGDDAGTSALIFAISLPILLGAVGLGVDLGVALNVKTRLSNALDKSALAVASSTGNQAELEDVMNKYFDANYPEDSLGTPYDLTLVINEDDNTVTLSGKADVKTSFMHYFGRDIMTVSAETEVTRDLSGLEVVLVLDVTGSMAGSNIEALRTAATNFINIMFDEITDPSLLKIGIVPYSTAVNVGPYGLGENPDGSYYDSAFVNNPDGKLWSLDDDQEWRGCVLARPEPDDGLDTYPYDWDMYEHYHMKRGACIRYWGWWCLEYEEIPDPNYNCTEEYIMPLNNDENALIDKVQSLDAGGWTLSNIGLAWGWRVISPDFPFTEGEDYDNNRWRKAILFMTDGDNRMAWDYSAYGPTSGHNIGDSDLDWKMADVCEEIKDEGITLYTVTFESGVGEETQEYFRNCATTPDMYTHAPSQDELINTFEDIANQLSKLHISR